MRRILSPYLQTGRLPGSSLLKCESPPTHSARLSLGVGVQVLILRKELNEKCRTQYKAHSTRSKCSAVENRFCSELGKGKQKRGDSKGESGYCVWGTQRGLPWKVRRGPRLTTALLLSSAKLKETQENLSKWPPRGSAGTPHLRLTIGPGHPENAEF